MFVDVVCFFFFKQKTAYEMRISDWSSDVCSSYLADLCHDVCSFHFGSAPITASMRWTSRQANGAAAEGPQRSGGRLGPDFIGPRGTAGRRGQKGWARSNENTSEIQSLMRQSYADFCMKNKNNTRQSTYHSMELNLQHRNKKK